MAKVYRSAHRDLVIPRVDLSTFVLDKPGAHVHDDAPAAIDGVTGETITFKGFRQRVDRLAAGLHQLGFGRGDVLAVFSPNHIEYGIAFFAAARLGASTTTANPTYTHDELNFQLTDSNAKYLITIPELLPLVEKAVVGTNVRELFVFGNVGTHKARTVRSLYRYTAPPPVKIDANDDIALVYSSGTTGRPKGTQLTHFNLVANIMQTVAHESYTAQDRFILVLPMYHIYGLMVIMLMSHYLRATVVYLPKFDFGQFLGVMAKYRITVAPIVPPIILAMAKQDVVSKFDLSALRVINSGAAPLTGEIEAAARARFTKTVVKQGYGMTELSPVSHSTPIDRVKTGSVGTLLPNCESRLVDPETGKDVAPGKEGELWVRGPNVMKGYLNNPKATADTVDKEGWLHTGDIARVDSDGYFYITDRIKELIKYKGLQVAPAELEGVLLQHPAVLDAAVISQADKEAGEIPKAYIVVAPGNTADAKLIAEIASYVEKKVAPHKKLRGGIEVIDAIPKAASGKILRRILKTQNEAKLKAKL